MHLKGTRPTNGAAERLVHTFKQALRKSNLPCKSASQELLMQYWGTPIAGGYSPSKLLTGRQIRTKIDVMLTSPAQAEQRRKLKETPHPSKLRRNQDENPYQVGMPCYALEEGQHARNNPRWVPAEIEKVYGTRSVRVRVLSNGARWRRHVDQLRPRYVSDPNTCITDCEQANKPQIDTLQDGNHQNLPSTSSRSLSEKQGPSKERNHKNITSLNDGIIGGISRRLGRPLRERRRKIPFDCQVWSDTMSDTTFLSRSVYFRVNRNVF